MRVIIEVTGTNTKRFIHSRLLRLAEFQKNSLRSITPTTV